MFFDATGSFISPLPWLRNEKDERKIVLLYALTERLPSDGSPLITSLEHIHLRIMCFLSGSLDETEQKRFRKPNCGPKHAIVNYSEAVIKALIHYFSGD